MEPALTWVPGTPVGGYILLKEIARGGMGEIWLAHHRGPGGFDRLVVIKRIIASTEEEPAFVNMFLDEARIASQLHHPNVVQVFELSQLGTSYYLVMEYLPGQTLGRVARRIMRQLGLISSLLAVELVSEAARGLGYAHQRKGVDGKPLRIVHRDVSPQNLLITYDGHVKVLDFGIAQAVGRLTHTRTGTVRGKIAYMSPQQAMALPVDASTDVFALGVILFELVTNTRLWHGAEDLVILKTHAEGTAMPRARDRAPELDPQLDQLIARALAVKTEDRFVDGHAFHLALDDWMRRQRRGTDSLERVMRTVFAEEIEQLPELERAPAVTPSGGDSSRELPDAMSPPLKPARRGPAPWLLAVVALAFAVVGAFATSSILSRVSAPPVSQPAPQPVVVAKPAKVPAPVVVVAPVIVDAGVVLVEAPAAVVAPRHVEVAKGKLSLETDPWTRVSIGGRQLGETPLLEVPLPVGKQRLRLVNEHDGVDTVVEVVITAGQTTVKRLSF